MTENRKDLVAAYVKSIKAANNEAAKKEIFISFLTAMYGGQDDQSVIAQFTAGAEKPVTNIVRTGRRSEKGRADTQYGNVIIEFEHDLVRTGEHAEMQLKEYLVGNWNSGLQNRFTLITTDCLRWRVHTLDYDSLLGFGSLSADELRLKLVDECDAAKDSADEFYLFLDRYLFGVQPVRATLEEIRRRFGEKSDIFQSVFLLMRKAFREYENSPEISVAMEQWKRFLGIAYGHFDASEGIFLIQSYLSVLAKLLAWKVISRENWLSDEKIREVIDGEAFRKLNVANFTDNDFYRWTATKNGNLAAAFRIIAQELATLDFSDVDEDILKGVYQELVDDDTRHALGEHYTPDWLCAKITQAVNPRSGQRILDPSCGSGSFLKAVANHLIRLKPDITAGELNASLFGIDVHPLSVQIAKATMLIAYGARLAAEPVPLNLNIFLANSLLLPEEDISLLGETYAVAIDDRKVEIPAAVFRNETLFEQMISAAEFLAQKNFEDGKERERSQLESIFGKRLEQYGGGKEAIEAGISIYRALLAAKQAHRNGIWAYILANTFAPVFLKKSFDIILGNPPWLVFRDVVAKDYQNELRQLAARLNVLPDSETLFTHLELAAIFVGYCLNYFLKPEGRLAFVMPRSIFVADQHQKLREGKILNTRVTELWDLQKVTPLFRVPSCVLFCVREKAEKMEEIPGRTFSGTLSAHNARPEEADARLKNVKTVFYLATLNGRSAWSENKICLDSTSFYMDKFRNGASLIPRSMCFVDIDQHVSGEIKNRLLRVKSADAVYRDAKKPWKSVRLSGTVHSRFLFETALAKNMVPFGLNGCFLVALPLLYDAESTYPVLSNAAGIEAEGELESAEWFRQAERKWLENRTERMAETGITYQGRLDWQHELVNQNLRKRYVVIYTSSGVNAVATVIDRSSISLPFVVENETFWHASDNKEEALYLCAFLNSNIPNQIIKPFQAKGLYGPRHICKKILEVPLPEYDPDNPAHNEIAALAVRASEKVRAFLEAKGLDRNGGNMTAIETGRFRKEVKGLVADELAEIDRRVAAVCGLDVDLGWYAEEEE